MSSEKDEVQIVDVSSELAKLGADGNKKGLIKGCLFNLIVYSQDSQRCHFLKEIIQAVMETFPCRIIFIECESSTREDFLKVTVEEETVKKNGSIISCDKIHIKCSSKYLNRVPYIVLPHFVPDLPIYLLWGQDPSQENEILPHLQKVACRLIFDSDSASDIRNFCREMLSQSTFKNLSVTDMNWASLTSWRETLFQVFDTPEKIEQLRSCKQLIVHYNNKPSQDSRHTERRAIYLQGWIAAQLNWQYIDSSFQNESIKISYKNRQDQTDIILIGQNISDLPSGAIVEIEIHTQNDTVFDMLRMSAQPFIKVHISTKDVCELPLTFPLRHAKKGLLFMNEIFFVPCSNHYWNMLKTIEAIQIPC